MIPDNYSDAHAELQDILDKLKNNEINIDDLEATMNRAVELVKFCQGKLRTIESNLNELFDQGNDQSKE